MYKMLQRRVYTSLVANAFCINHGPASATVPVQV